MNGRPLKSLEMGSQGGVSVCAGFSPYGCGDGRFPRFRPARLLAEVERIAAYRELVAFVHRIIDALGDSGDPDSRAPRQFVGGGG